MKWTPDLIVKLAFLLVGVVIILALVVCILCGYDGKLVDALIGVATVVFAANVWKIGSGLAENRKGKK